ncbi:hypothetical protein [uncultured Clostridium sp.]|uniref:hypothetical protein n=1 Tax=uncultured Clostridium sp. TaxID=59620 RepID=UPI0028EC079D|nr:hypothetical protein [uncultured Clostridium sp.]
MPAILLIIGFILVIYNYRAIKREEQRREEDSSLNISFRNVLQDNKKEFNDYKMEIGILRKDIAESLTELQEEIVDIKNNFNELKNYNRVYENKAEPKNNIGENLIIDSKIEDKGTYENDYLEKEESDKTQRIKNLLKEGLTVEEVCYKLSVSKGEVLLVKGLYKK